MWCSRLYCCCTAAVLHYTALYCCCTCMALSSASRPGQQYTRGERPVLPNRANAACPPGWPSPGASRRAVDSMASTNMVGSVGFMCGGAAAAVLVAITAVRGQFGTTCGRGHVTVLQPPLDGAAARVHSLHCTRQEGNSQSRAIARTAICQRPHPYNPHRESPAGAAAFPPTHHTPACEVMRSTMGCHCPLRSLKPRNCSTGLQRAAGGRMLWFARAPTKAFDRNREAWNANAPSIPSTQSIAHSLTPAGWARAASCRGPPPARPRGTAR